MPSLRAARGGDRENRYQFTDFPSVWSVVDRDNIVYEGQGKYTYVGAGRSSDDDIGLIKTVNPLDSSRDGGMSGFEIVLTSTGEKKFIALGICSDKYPSHSLPGWEKVSVGLHMDDGSLMQSPNEAIKTKQTFQRGDLIKCSIKDIPSDATKHAAVEVEFFCNNDPVISTVVVKPPGGFYGVIGMMSKGEAVTLCPPVASKKLMFEEVWEVCTPDLVRHTEDGVCMYIGPGDLSEHFIGTFRSIKPVDPLGSIAQRSFSLRIIDPGEKNFIGMGVVNKTYPTGLLPGWEDSSIGYHADSGDIFHRSSDGDPTNCPCGKGDTMQCVVRSIDNSPKRINVLFLCNGVKVKEVTDWTPSTGFYFSFGMMSKGERVQAVLPEVCIPFSVPKLPFEEVWEIKNANIEHTNSGICCYVGQDKKVGTVRSKCPVDPFGISNYFEVKIIEPGRNCYIALGVCSQLYSSDQLPGWEDLSVGYHADEGAIIQSTTQDKVGNPCVKGDVIRCTLKAVDGSDKQMNVIFHKNGTLLGKTIFWKPGDGKVFAQVGCMSEGEVIQIASPQQGVHLQPEGLSAVQSPGESRPTTHAFTSPVVGAQGKMPDQYDLQTMYHQGMQHFLEEMYSKMHSFVPSSSGSQTMLVPGLPRDSFGTPSSWDTSRHTAPHDLSSSYPVPPTQSTNPGQKILQSQISEPPFIGQQAYFPQMSISSSSSSSSKVAGPPSQVSHQFSVSSVSSLESVLEDEEKGGASKIPHEKQHQLSQSMKPVKEDYLTFSVPSLPTLDQPIMSEKSDTSVSQTPVAQEASVPPSLCDPETAENSLEGIPSLKSSSMVIDPVILEKRCSALFKILHNTEVDEEGSLEYVRLHKDSPENSFVMFRLPLNEKCNYFEVEILDHNESCNVAVGIVWDHYPINHLPGTLDGSVAFHTKDSCIWQGEKSLQYEISIGTGDVLGCRVDLHYKSEVVSPDSKEALVLTEFFRNGILLHSLELALPPCGFFPAIGMTGFGSKITVHQNPLLKPDSYFKDHPLPNDYLNFEMNYANEEEWQPIVYSKVTNKHLFSSGLCCGKPGVIQSNLPFSIKSDYFQVRLLSEIGSYSVLSIGIASKLTTDSTKVIPGEILNSVAYLPLLGFFMSSGVICWTIPAVVGSSLYGKNVALGVGISYSSLPDSSESSDKDKETKTVNKINLFFTVNGQQIHNIFIDKPSNDIYPTFAFEHDSRMVTTEPLALLEFPKPFPNKENDLPFGFCRGKQDELVTLFDSYTVKDMYVTDSSDITHPVRTMQASQPLSTSRSYYEVKVMDGGETYKISCGLACYNYPMDQHPGWMGTSIALHIDDGNLFIDGNYTNVIVPPRYPGVIIGCGIRFSISGTSAEVFFTVNKQIIACRLVTVPQLGFFPTVGMRTRGGVIDINVQTVDPFPLIFFKSEVELQHNIALDGSCIQLQSSSNPGAIQMRDCSQLQNNYIEVTCKSERNGRILVGYSTNKSCPLNFLKSQAFKACVIDLVSGKLMMYNQYYKSRDACSIPTNSVIGIGLKSVPNSKLLLLFIVSNGFMVSCCEIDIEDSGIYPCVLMMDSTTKIDVSWCSLWPKLTSIGYGWGAFVNLKLIDLKITHSSTQNKKRLPVGYAQAATPLSHSSSYFEVQICSRATNKAIAIGLASRYHSTSQWIGWSENSIGYHTDDGKLFKESSSGQSFGPKAYAGDIIGCGARLRHVCIKDTITGAPKIKVEIFFTINGALLNTQKMAIPPGGLFPTLCLESPSESVVFHRYDQFPPVSSLVDADLWSNAYAVKQVGSTISNCCRHKEINGGLPKSFCQAKLPFSPEYPYFQVELANIGVNPKGNIFVGASVKIPVGCTTPNTHSLLYSSAGSIVTRKGSQKSTKGSVKSDVGDTVGCFVSFDDGYPNQMEVFVNYAKVYTTSLTDLWNPQDLYPTIVLSHPGDSVVPGLQMKLPSQCTPLLIGWLRTERVQVRNNIIEYTAKGDKMSDIGVAQLSQSLQLNSLTYFEVEIISSVKCVAAVGAASSDYPLNRQPGWCKNSIAYHGDDGKLFHEDGVGVSFASAWKQYDIIGLGIRADYGGSESSVQVYFTKNGVEQGHTTASIPPSGFFPIVGFHNEGLKVKIHLGIPGRLPCNVCPLKSRWRALLGVSIKNSSRGQLLRHCVNNRDTTRAPYLISLAIYGQYFCDKMQFYEVEIYSMGHIGIAIGVVPQKYPLNQAPGWSAGSVAYHTDNGRLYNAASKGKQFGPIAQSGDVIGCGVIFHPNNTKYCSVFFTYNGVEIGRVKMPYQVNGLYPAVALTNSHDSVSVSFSEKFKSRLSLSEVVFVNLMRINNCSYTDHIISFMGSGSSGFCNTPATAQFSIPLSRTYNYYSASILECNDDILWGLAVKDYPLQYAPGITSISLAYDAMKGSVRAVYSSDNFVATSAEVCCQGDNIGCGICFSEDSKEKSTYVYFTRNNRQVCKLDIPDEVLFEDLYPIVGFIPQKKSSFIFMNWNCMKFVERNVF